jgi:hypothetical protein
LLHWGVLKGSDEVFEAILNRLHSTQPVSQGIQDDEQSTQLRKLLLRADHYSDNPVTRAVRANAAMKVRDAQAHTSAYTTASLQRTPMRVEQDVSLLFPTRVHQGLFKRRSTTQPGLMLAALQVYLIVKAEPWALIWAPSSQHSSALNIAVQQWKNSSNGRSNEVRHCCCHPVFRYSQQPSL